MEHFRLGTQMKTMIRNMIKSNHVGVKNNKQQCNNKHNKCLQRNVVTHDRAKCSSSINKYLVKEKISILLIRK